MKVNQNRLMVLLLVGALSLVMGACSTSKSAEGEDETPVAVEESEEVGEVAELEEPAAGEPTGDEVYLRDLLQEPEFSEAFGSMEGSSDLPDWVEDGGTATPVETVEVGGDLYLAAQACKPHDCPSERIFVLYERSSNTAQGVYITDAAEDHADANVSDEAEYHWLGEPDDLTKAWIKKQLTSAGK